MSEIPPAKRTAEASDQSNPSSHRKGLLAPESAESFRLLIESVKDYAIFLLDPDGYIMSWNPGAERIKGYNSEEIVGKHFSTFYTQEAKDRSHPQHELEIALEVGRYEEEGWRVRKDGTTFWANVVITTLYGDEGEVRGFAKVTRDMTERKKTEEALRNSRDVLEQSVQERTLELTRANQILQAEVQRRQQLEDSLRSQTDQLQIESEYKDGFLAMLAHELRNPMGALSNALHVLLLGQPGTPAFERAKDVALRQMAHQTRLVDDLLDVSRMIRNKIELKHEILDLVQVLREVADDHRAFLEKADVSLLLDVPQEPVTIVGDRTRLTQVFGNLIDNGRKFTLPGGQISVRLTVDATAGRASITLRDTGIGIDPVMLPRLFQPFSQADRSLERSRGGLGLGLALVKGLTELHGGTVSAHSEGLGKGAEFTLDLPVSVQPGGVRKAPAAQNDTDQRLRVLVIEDLPDAAETLRDLLEIFGYQVDLAYDGREGVRMALEHQPAIVLCDIGLPELDGYSVANEIHRNPATAFTPLIAVTGYGKEEDQRRSRAAGFMAHLTKPINPQELRQALEQIQLEQG